MKHKSMSQMNKERNLNNASLTFKEVKDAADNEESDYQGGKAYRAFLEMFYKNKKEEDESNNINKT
tara:strand:+ start:491 stop:688 length:198 start_codon:yes stop_codon:yes gene_type:complete